METGITTQDLSVLSAALTAILPNFTLNADGLVRLWMEEGIKGFYKGMVPAIFGVSNGAVQFMAYEEIRKAWGNHLARAGDNELVLLTPSWPCLLHFLYSYLPGYIPLYDHGLSIKGHSIRYDISIPSCEVTNSGMPFLLASGTHLYSATAYSLSWGVGLHYTHVGTGGIAWLLWWACPQCAESNASCGHYLRCI